MPVISIFISWNNFSLASESSEPSNENLLQWQFPWEFLHAEHDPSHVNLFGKTVHFLAFVWLVAQNPTNGRKLFIHVGIFASTAYFSFHFFRKSINYFSSTLTCQKSTQSSINNICALEQNACIINSLKLLSNALLATYICICICQLFE